MGYKVHTDIFEGPFDLLLRLITEQRVDLYEVALADIVDGFLAEVEAMQRLDLEVATEFLVIAATLVELKCRRLLPGREEPDEEGLALLEERDYLLARLVECTTFSAAGAQLASAELAASKSWPRLAGLDERFEGLQPDLLAYLSAGDVRAAALRALQPRPTPHVEVDHVLVDEVTVAEVVETLCASLPGSSPTSFRALTSAARTRMEVVVHFLGSSRQRPSASYGCCGQAGSSRPRRRTGKAGTRSGDSVGVNRPPYRSRISTIGDERSRAWLDARGFRRGSG